MTPAAEEPISEGTEASDGGTGPVRQDSEGLPGGTQPAGVPAAPAAGKLNAHLVKIQKRVSDLIYETYHGLLERNPPSPEEQRGIFRANATAMNQAQEIVLSLEFPPRLPPDEIEDEIPAGTPDALIET